MQEGHRRLIGGVSLLFMLATVLGGCRGRAEREARPDGAVSDSAAAAGNARADAVRQPQTEEERLRLVDFLPLGSSYEAVRQRFPQTGALEAEGPGGLQSALDLAEAVTPARVFGRDAVLEFNFEDGRLYSYYYALEGLGCAAADSLYERLQRFYDGHYGAHREELDREHRPPAASSYWTTPDFGLAATRSGDGQACRLSWGFQVSSPYDKLGKTVDTLRE